MENHQTQLRPEQGARPVSIADRPAEIKSADKAVDWLPNSCLEMRHRDVILPNLLLRYDSGMQSVPCTPSYSLSYEEMFKNVGGAIER